MKRILVIDDDEMIRDVLKELLEINGYAVELASNGKMGVELYQKAPADVVITDMIMPQSNGILAILSIRKNYPEAKIIAISGGGRNVTHDYLYAANQFGANKTFQKPVDSDELLSAVDELVNEKVTL